MMGKRVKYLDVAKFIGIFCIYLGHFGDAAGYAYSFVFTFHVALFFFLSGCSEWLSTERPWKQYFYKTFKGIMGPFYLFAITAVVFRCVLDNTYANVGQNLICILKGCIRNRFFAGGLWFLSCLFVVKLCFYILRKLLKSKLLILIACLALYLAAQLLIDPKPTIQPHMAYNIDSACYYMIFYGLGYCSFDKIHTLFAFDTVCKRVWGGILGGVSCAFSAALFFGKNVLYVFGSNAIVYLINCILTPCIVIFFVLSVSKLMQDVTLFEEMGKNTLYLCGSEYVMRRLIPICLQTVGLNIALPSPLSAYLYTFALLLLCNKLFVPAEKAVFAKLRFF